MKRVADDQRPAGLNARVTHLSRNTQWRNENILVIRLKRAYELPARSDGCRVLVDRLWPRGISKAELSIQSWPKPLAPSTLLRKWFNHNPARWTEFKDRYFRELDGRGDVASLLEELANEEIVTLVFAARDVKYNHAKALKEYIERHV